MPVLLYRFLGNAYRHLVELRWSALVCLVLVHAVVAWLLVGVAGEEGMSDPGTFLYFYAVTSTTIGYGDISPQTGLGRAVVVLWVMPGGIALFTSGIAEGSRIVLSAPSPMIDGLLLDTHPDTATLPMLLGGDKTP